MSTRLKSNWVLLREAMEGKHAKRFDAILETSDDIEFAKNYIKILEFVKPKMQRAEVITETEEQVIRIVHSYPEAK